MFQIRFLRKFNLLDLNYSHISPIFPSIHNKTALSYRRATNNTVPFSLFILCHRRPSIRAAARSREARNDDRDHDVPARTYRDGYKMPGTEH